MKVYSAAKMFKIEDFPLTVAYTRQASTMPSHYHDFIEIVLIGQGHSIHNIHTEDSRELSYGVINGDVFSVMPGEVHQYTESKNLTLYNIAFREEIIANEIKELSKLNSWTALFTPNPGVIRNKIHLTIAEYVAARKCLEKIIFELCFEKEGFKLSAKTAFLDFLIIATRGTMVEWKASADAQRSNILESMVLMEKSLDKPFSLKSYAQTAYMSVSAYTKKFRDAAGLSPLEYFIGLRLEKVRALLVETDRPISEIAAACGFSEPSYMIKLFRIRQGITPAKYRSLVRLPSVAAVP